MDDRVSFSDKDRGFDHHVPRRPGGDVGCEAASSDEVKTAWRYISTPPYIFIA
jgi:hypothetical protein